MAAMVESWMSELGKWKNRVEAQKKKPLMPKSKQFLQQPDLEQPKNDIVSADSDDGETTTLSESTVCLLIDRFAPL